MTFNISFSVLLAIKNHVVLGCLLILQRVDEDGLGGPDGRRSGVGQGRQLWRLQRARSHGEQVRGPLIGGPPGSFDVSSTRSISWKTGERPFNRRSPRQLWRLFNALDLMENRMRGHLIWGPASVFVRADSFDVSSTRSISWKIGWEAI